MTRLTIRLEAPGTPTRFLPARAFGTRHTVGEGPRWDPSHRVWTWIDMAEGSYHEGGAAPAVVFPAPLGCTARHADGSVLGACPDGLYRWNRESAPTRFASLPIAVSHLNDGACDASGRWWIGAVDTTGRNGSLLRVDLDGTVTAVADGYRLPNGIDWIDHGRTMLHADSYGHRIFAYDVDPATGAVADRRVWWQGSSQDGVPDGLTVDADGVVWVAFWGAGVVRAFGDRAGHAEQRAELRIPARQPSSVALGGDDGGEMLITSAASGIAASDPGYRDGDVFVLEGVAKARAENDCRVDTSGLRSG